MFLIIRRLYESSVGVILTVDEFQNDGAHDDDKAGDENGNNNDNAIGETHGGRR